MFIFLYVINFLLLLGSGFFIYKNYGLGFDLRTVINTFRMGGFGLQGSGVLLWSLTIILTLLTYLLFAVSLIVNLIFVIKYFKKFFIKRPPVIISLVVFIFTLLTYFVIVNYLLCVTNVPFKIFQFCKNEWQDQVGQILELGLYNKQLKPDTNLSQITWKTYTNKDYGFSFKYPSQFDVKIEKEISSRNFNDGENVKVTRYDFIFTTGRMVDSSNPDSLDFSGFTINVEPTNGKTIMQVFGRSPAAESLDPTYFFPIKQRGGANEAFIANGILVYRVKNLFYWSTTFQNSRLLPDGSDDVNQFRGRIFDTIIFK